MKKKYNLHFLTIISLLIFIRTNKQNIQCWPTIIARNTNRNWWPLPWRHLSLLEHSVTSLFEGHSIEGTFRAAIVPFQTHHHFTICNKAGYKAGYRNKKSRSSKWPKDNWIESAYRKKIERSGKCQLCVKRWKHKRFYWKKLWKIE